MKLLFFIDIDGTLLDENYHANSEDLQSTIRRLQQKGVVFALNSNRALSDMVPVANHFEIDGPLVSENGVFYANRKDVSKKMLILEEQALALQKEKRAFETELKKRLRKRYGDGFSWKTLDTVRLLSESASESVIEPGTLLFANNKYREFTTSVHVLVQTASGLEHVDAELLDAICDEMKHWCDTNEMHIAKGYEFTNILAYTNDCSKRSAVEELRKIYDDVRFCAIGNEDSDARMIDGIGEFYTVANAMESAKKAASYVARATTTRGVDEILKLVEMGEL